MRLNENNFSAYEYQVSVAPQFLAICEPLFKLGIKWFEYLKIFNDGGHLRLMNNLDYCRTYLSTIKNAGIFFTEQAIIAQNNGQHSYIMNDLNQFDKNKDPIVFLLHDFDIWNCYKIYKTSHQFIECYTFSLTRNEVHAGQLFLNYPFIFEHFTHYFNERASDLIDCRSKRKLAYYEQNFNFNKISQDNLLDQKIEQFFRRTQLKKKLLKRKDENIILSKRETECLEFLALGMSIKEIGRTLDLSPRTIEFYLNNVKSKAGISSREVLLSNFIKSNMLPHLK